MIPIILIAGVVGAIAYIVGRYLSDCLVDHEFNIQLYADEYKEALEEVDKDYARLVGKAYFSALRQGRLTQEDNETIADDLAAMH